MREDYVENAVKFLSHPKVRGSPVVYRRSFLEKKGLTTQEIDEALRSAVPDARYEVDDLIAEGDRVVVRWRLLGTHEGEFRGIAPTGRAIELKGIAIYRVDDGMLMERWVVSDLYGMLEESDAAVHR